MEWLSYLENASTVANQWLIDHQWMVVWLQVVLVAILCIIVLRSYVRMHPTVRERIRKMSAEERKELVKQLISDMICDGLENLEYEGLATRDEVNKWYLKFARKFDLRDLVPITLPEQALKKVIALRLKHGDYRKKVILPGDKARIKDKSFITQRDF